MKRLFILSILLGAAFIMQAQDIQLPEPVRTGGKPLMEAFELRQSSRNFSGREIDRQTLSSLLWAAYGFNREDKRTVPSSQNRQEIDLYVMFKDGVYFYDAKQNLLKIVLEGDYRKGLGGQEFAHTAPVNLICVGNLDRASSRESAYLDSGYILQNVHLFCASEGLGAVIRGSFDRELLTEYLGLTSQQEVIITQVVGYTE